MPNDWPDLSEEPSSELPMSMRQLTDIDLEIRYQAELKSRVSLEEAKHFVNDREKKRFPIVSNNLDEPVINFKAQSFRPSSENPIQLYDEPSRSSVNVKDNIIDQDDIFKYFSIMPPSSDDSRLTENYTNYIISALAAVLQGHYWQHCPSCFKFSKRTNSGNSCRYCYPKDRVIKTIVDKKGISLVRFLGHEYINSFNDILLQTFRCNHDIQILIGGVEMSEAIYYCTKYTTKPQQEAYCSVALALSSYRRRLEREKAAAELRSLTDEEISRKRVTGLMHTMTNSIEIAGPLAALYILRQSPSYSSHSFSSISLDSILRWLFPENLIKNQHKKEESVDLIKSFSFLDKNKNENENEESDSDDDTIRSNENDDFLNKNMTRHELYGVVRPTDDYKYRSEKFDELSLYEFNCKVYRSNRKENEEISDQGFMKEHPLHLTHVLRQRIKEVVPIINGKKPKLLTNNSDTTEKNENSLLSLVLYKPFRNPLTDLKNDNESWYDAFQSWIPSPEIKQLMMNSYDLDVARRRSGEIQKMQRIEKLDNSGSDSSESSSENEEDNQNSDDGFHLDDFVDGITYGSDYNNLDFDELTNDDNDPVRFPISTSYSDRTTRSLQKISGNKLFRRNVAIVSDLSPKFITDQHNYLVTARTTNIQQLKEWIKDSNSHNHYAIAEIIDEKDNNINIEVLNTRVNEFEHALMKENSVWKGNIKTSLKDTNSIPIIKKGAFISCISSAYNLNKLQHIAFRLIAKAMIKRWLKRDKYILEGESKKVDILKIDSLDYNDQICMVLAGEGGTGKSRVINAVDALCLSWDKTDSLIKAAPTGKAAVLISGKTLASVLLRLRHSKSDVITSCIIIDEMSMMTLKDIHDLDVRLRRITGIKMRFGGISVVLCGDFLQLPPAGGSALYKRPLNFGGEKTSVNPEINDLCELNIEEEEEFNNHLAELKKRFPDIDNNKATNKISKKKQKQIPDAHEVNGYDLWYNHFTTVVYLEESMRFLKDPQWGYELSFARKGVWSPELIEMINGRLLTTSQELLLNNVDIHHLLTDSVVSLPDPSKPETMKCTVFATPSNVCKQAINNIFTQAMSKCMPSNMLPIRVVADFWGQLNNLSVQDKAYIMGLDESKFGRLAPFLDLVIGMPIMVTQNEEPLKGIANGTFGILEDIQFPTDTKFRTIFDDVLEIEVLVPSKLPLLAWIRTNRGAGAAAPPVNGHESLTNRTDLFPIYPRQPFLPAKKIKLRSRESRGEIRYLKNLKITQLPIIPCSASTAYKLQGETLESEVIVDWKSETHVINKRQQAYLMLSRCTTRYALITLNTFTEYLAKWFVPEQDVLDEDDRLKQLSNKLVMELDKEEEIYLNFEEEKTTTTEFILDTHKHNSVLHSDFNDNTMSVHDNNNTNFHINLITSVGNKKNNKNIYNKTNISGSREPNIATVNNEINYSEEILSNEITHLLSERKRPLTPDEKDIVKKSLYCNRQNKNDIIITRCEVYIIKQ